jgi:aminotransferase
MEFAKKLLMSEKVAVVPGTAFGECGEGFIRCSYATSMDGIKMAMEKIEKFIKKLS